MKGTWCDPEHGITPAMVYDCNCGKSYVEEWKTLREITIKDKECVKNGFLKSPEPIQEESQSNVNQNKLVDESKKDICNLCDSELLKDLEGELICTKCGYIVEKEDFPEPTTLTEEQTNNTLKKLREMGFEVTKPAHNGKYGVDILDEDCFNEIVNEALED